jgi:ectoine hydroxylase-related dioxygenase (phytanoyl-CoA dioxygenase family)
LPAPLPTTLIEEFRGEFGAAIESGRYSHQAGSSDRIHGAHYLPAGRRIWLHPPVIDFLKAHFRDPPCACQTLTFINGSEQSGHQDTIHLTPYPAGYMCGVWIALEDVKPESGELFVYPGSHRTPRLRAADLGLAKVTDNYSAYVAFDAAISELLREGGYERMAYRPKAGDILVWHENLIHGGSPRLDRGQSRLSIVSHYFAQGAVGYYDSRGEAATLEALPTV